MKKIIIKIISQKDDIVEDELISCRNENKRGKVKIRRKN